MGNDNNKTRATGQELLERRTEQLEMRLRGFKRKQIVKKLTDKYGVSPSSIDRDWKNKSDWIHDALGIANLDNIKQMVVGQFNYAVEVRHQVLTDLKNMVTRYKRRRQNKGEPLQAEDMDKLSSIYRLIDRYTRAIEEDSQRKVDLLSDLGYVEKQPDKVLLGGSVELSEADEKLKDKLEQVIDVEEVEDEKPQPLPNQSTE